MHWSMPTTTMAEEPREPICAGDGVSSGLRGVSPSAAMQDYMSRFRLLLAWLVMAALPLQGLAAASMLFCGVDRAVVAQASDDGYVAHEHRGSSQASSHDHGAHGHGSQDHAKSDPGSGKPATGDQDKQGHACPICASCCQVVALGGFEPFPQTSALPSSEPSAPVVRVATRTATVPDKPPRA